MTEITPAKSFLEQATKALSDRAIERDSLSGERSMSRTVKLFNAWREGRGDTSEELTETDGWIFMIFLKLVRGDQGNFRADDYIDAAGYAALAGESKSKERTVDVLKNSKVTPAVSSTILNPHKEWTSSEFDRLKTIVSLRDHF